LNGDPIKSCGRCGATILNAMARFCPRCGGQLPVAPEAPPPAQPAAPDATDQGQQSAPVNATATSSPQSAAPDRSDSGCGTKLLLLLGLGMVLAALFRLEGMKSWVVGALGALLFLGNLDQKSNKRKT